MSDSEMQEPPSPDMDNEHGRAAAKRTAELEYSVEDLKRALHMILAHKRMWGTTLGAETAAERVGRPSMASKVRRHAMAIVRARSSRALHAPPCIDLLCSHVVARPLARSSVE